MIIVKWLKNGNDCSMCKWCWEDCISNENGTEYDCGCYIKGLDFDEKRCYLVNPLKWIYGKIIKRKHDYYFAHQFDGLFDFYEKEELERKKMKEVLAEVLNCKYIVRENADGRKEEIDIEHILQNYVWKIRDEYEEYAHPFVYKTLWKQWKELIIKTCRKFINLFKPYFCK